MGYRVNSAIRVIKSGDSTVVTREILVNRIKYYRKLRNLTQTDLGKRVGLTKSSISKIETGASGLTAFCALRICKVLDVTFEELFSIL